MATTEQASIEQDLKGKLAVVTGASRGIGRAIAENLASRGCHVLGTCSSEESLKTFTQSLSKSNSYPGQGAIHPFIANHFSESCVSTILSQLISSEDSKSRNLDILILNASDSRDGTLGQLSESEISDSLTANITTPVLLMEGLLARQLFNPNSRIVFISSVRSRLPWKRQLMYAATKSAGESLVRTWAQALGGREPEFGFMRGSTVNSVSVGLTGTESVMMCPEEMLEEFKREFLSTQCFDRMAEAGDIADVVGLLVRREAGWISGQVVGGNGGGVKLQ